MFDLVIIGGRVVDPESDLDDIRNVGITNGRISAVTEDRLEGFETIDAKGLVVAPGFIDGHCHGTDAFSRKVALRDGLTTMMDFEGGFRDAEKFYGDSAGKTQNNYGAVVCAAYARLMVLDGPDVAEKGNDTGGMLGVCVNAAVAKALKENRQVGWSNVIPNKEQLTEILSIVDEGLRQGACGVGVPVGYMTHGVTSYEMYKYQEISSRYGRLTNAHTRFAGSKPPTEAALGIQELLCNGLVLDAPVMGAHLNGIQDWQYTIPLFNKARANGAKVWGEVHPYAAGSTIAAADIISEEQMDSLGITYSDVANASDGKRWTKEMYDDIRKNDPGRAIIIYVNPIEEVAQWLAMPGVVVVSDSMPVQDDNLDYYPWDTPFEGKSCHPRTAGSRGKVLRMVRELKMMPLIEAVSKMSYLHAKYFYELAGIPQFRFKGRIQVGCDADITIFDPEMVRDNATCKPGEGCLPTTGIPYVIVNGVIVVKDSEVLKVFPGQPIRFPVQSKGRLHEIKIQPRHLPPLKTHECCFH